MSKEIAIDFVKKLKELELDVPKIEISRLGALNFVSCFSERPTDIMANNASAGVDFEPDTAIAKALVEYFERLVFQDGIENKNPACRRIHSDGVAAFPSFLPNYSQRARENAFSEAVERFVWAKWWDEVTFSHTMVDLKLSQFWKNKNLRITVEAFEDLCPVDKIFLVSPKLEEPNQSVLILFWKIKGLGYITGGAAGKTEQQSQIVVRALSELIRHGIGVQRFTKSGQLPNSFYEKRLVYFGLGKGNDLVERRLDAGANNFIRLPELEIDTQLESEGVKNVVCVHRCLFKGQPPFVDGPLERLCL